MNISRKAFSVIAFAIAALGANTARADAVLWYNGNADLTNGLSNEINSTVSDARVFDNFTVTDATGWTIDRIWSNNRPSASPSTRWKCRA